MKQSNLLKWNMYQNTTNVLETLPLYATLLSNTLHCIYIYHIFSAKYGDSK